MKVRTPKTEQGVYVEFRDRHRRKKSECVTLDGCTPKQALKLLLLAVRQQQQRKAG